MGLPDLSDLLGEHRIFLLNRSATYAIGVAETLPLAGILSTDRGIEYAFLEERLRTPILCLNQRPGWYPALEEAAMEEMVNALAEPLLAMFRSTTTPASIWCPRYCHRAWQFAEQHDLGNLCAPVAITGWMIDKRNALPKLAELGLRTLPGQWLNPGSESFASLKQRFGLPFVTQTPISVAGMGTTIVSEEKDYRAACTRSSGDALWAAPYCGDLSLNINACVTPHDVFVAYPSVQLTGLSFAGVKGPIYCGNDYAATASISENARRDVAEQTFRAGEWLRQKGYVGIYGLDFVQGADGHFHPVDLNPRWQGSTALLAQAEQLDGRIPLAVVDVAARLHLLTREELQRHGERSAEPISASQFFLYSPDTPTRCNGQVSPGAHKLASALEWQRPGCHLVDLAGRDEVLIGGAVPAQGLCIDPKIPVLRVFRRTAVLEASLCSCEPWAAEVATALYDQLALETLGTVCGNAPL